jgi:hypothetical protein
MALARLGVQYDSAWHSNFGSLQTSRQNTAEGPNTIQQGRSQDSVQSTLTSKNENIATLTKLQRVYYQLFSVRYIQ